MHDRRAVPLLAALCLVANGAGTAAAAQRVSGEAVTPGVAGPPLVAPPAVPDTPAPPADGPPCPNLFTPAEAGPLLQAAEAAQVPPEPEHTGFGALLYGTANDFAAFPRRKSTWVILGIGASAAAIAYPFDDELNEKLQDADGLRKALTPGKYRATAGCRAARP